MMLLVKVTHGLFLPLYLDSKEKLDDSSMNIKREKDYILCYSVIALIAIDTFFYEMACLHNI